MFSRDLEETVANIARFSAKDAQTFRDWNRRAETVTRNIFLPERFSEPLPHDEREKLLSLSAIGRWPFLGTLRFQWLQPLWGLVFQLETEGGVLGGLLEWL